MVTCSPPSSALSFLYLPNPNENTTITPSLIQPSFSASMSFKSVVVDKEYYRITPVSKDTVTVQICRRTDWELPQHSREPLQCLLSETRANETRPRGYFYAGRDIDMPNLFADLHKDMDSALPELGEGVWVISEEPELGDGSEGSSSYRAALSVFTCTKKVDRSQAPEDSASVSSLGQSKDQEHNHHTFAYRANFSANPFFKTAKEPNYLITPVSKDTVTVQMHRRIDWVIPQNSLDPLLCLLSETRANEIRLRGYSYAGCDNDMPKLFANLHKDMDSALPELGEGVWVISKTPEWRDGREEGKYLCCSALSVFTCRKKVNKSGAPQESTSVRSPGESQDGGKPSVGTTSNPEEGSKDY